VLTLHPDKTRLIEFGRFAAANRARRCLGKPETFTFLGFTHICGRSRTGRFQLRLIRLSQLHSHFAGPANDRFLRSVLPPGRVSGRQVRAHARATVHRPFLS
jgi:hypothetical protein